MVVQGSVGTVADFVTDSWFQINVDGTRDVLSRGSFTEEGVERVSGNTGGGVAWHHTIWFNAVLEAVKFPAGITDLDTGLTKVDGDDFTHDDGFATTRTRIETLTTRVLWTFLLKPFCWEKASSERGNAADKKRAMLASVSVAWHLRDLIRCTC